MYFHARIEVEKQCLDNGLARGDRYLMEEWDSLLHVSDQLILPSLNSQPFSYTYEPSFELEYLKKGPNIFVVQLNKFRP